MNYLHDRLYGGERLMGMWTLLGNSMTVEMAGRAGFDWVLIDREHGVGDYADLVPQLQAAAATPAAPVVRVPWNDAVMIKRVLDLGAAGIMVPYVQSAAEATEAVRAMRYPPEGIRGISSLNRHTEFGANFDEYFTRSNRELLTIVQVETATGVAAADEIAAVDGVDVLFVGPQDLSTSLGIRGEYDHPDFLAALDTIIGAAERHGRTAGILVLGDEMLAPMVERGMRFIAFGTDGGIIANGMRRNADLARKLKER